MAQLIIIGFGGSSGAIASGEYDPTITSDVGNPVGNEFVWSRVGNVVTVSGIVAQIENPAGFIRCTLPVPGAQRMSGTLTYGGVNASGGDPDAMPVGTCIVDQGPGDTAEVQSELIGVHALPINSLWTLEFSYSIP